jgi:hypothetical protein
MKKYLLLRENLESGPYTREELEAHGPEPDDLVWVDGQSTSWEPISTLSGNPSGGQERKMPWEEAETGRDGTAAFVELSSRPNRNKGSMVAAAMGVSLVSLFIMGMAGGWLKYGKEEPDRAFITRNMSMDPMSTSYRNALKTEVVRPDSVTKAKTKAKLKDIKKQVNLTASEYKVGILGGISDLSLNIENNSPHLIDKVMVEVDFQKNNGKVIQTENFQLNRLKPGASKTLEIPQSKRGTKISYRITRIVSEQYNELLKNI